MSELQVVSVECATRGTMHGKGSWIGCDGECQNWYHFNCVGLSVTDEPPKGDWFCPRCSTTLVVMVIVFKLHCQLSTERIYLLIVDWNL